MRRAAFTLMELLVVISIIAVLASMLMPAIAMVRNGAKDATCRAHLRQVHLGALSYAADQDGMAVPAYLPGNQFWHTFIAAYVDAVKAGATNSSMGNIRQTSSVIWGCPNRRLAGSMGSVWAPGYGINMWLMKPVRDPATNWDYGNGLESGSANTNGWWGIYRDFPLASLTQPSQRTWWGEGTSWTVDFIDTIYPTGQPSYTQYRHTSHNNTMFIDGHAAGLKNDANSWQSVNDPAKYQ